MTDDGTAMGTYPYMAPEQLEGKTVDARADLFALGAVLYEMATGCPAFPGATYASVSAAILTSDPPPLTSLRPAAPSSLERLVKTLLAKDPSDRVQTAHDVVLRLRDIADESTRGPASVAANVRGRNRRAVGIVLGLVCALAVAAVAWKWLWPLPAPLPPARVVRLTTLRGVLWSPTFSPDGQQVAFQWQGEKRDNWDIYLKMVDSPEVRRLTTEAAVDVMPSWSPDGRQIAFQRAPAWGESGKIHLVSPIGGSDRKLGDLPVDGPLSWSPDGRWRLGR